MNYYYQGYDEDYNYENYTNYDENYTNYFLDGGNRDNLWYVPPSFIKNRLIPGIFVTIFIVGLFGNSLVLYVFMKNKPLRTVTHMFLVNLAAVDLLYIIMCIPFSAALSWLGTWPFGNTLCKLTNYLMVTCMSVSTLTLIAVGVDQYFAVVHPVFTFLACRRSGRAVLEITAIWVISLLSFISVFVLSEEIDIFGNKFCEITWERSQKQAYTAVVTVIFYIVPQIILGFCYIQIARKMKQSMHNQQTQLTEVTLKIRRRVVRLVFIVTMAFVLCWLPLHLSAVNDAFHISDSEFFYNLRLFSPCFSFLTTAINPVIYCFFNRTFRKFFKATFTCKSVVFNGPLVGEEAEAFVRNAQRAVISREQNRPRPSVNQNISRPLVIQVRPASNVYVAPDIHN